jgi:putative ubiquitin-RnfH superfamily antitoxin RatB of RatAB toxin-antitoxin module
MAEAAAGTVDAVVVYAVPGRAHLFGVRLPAGSSVGAAIQACGILSAVAELAGQQLDVGVFGRSCGLEATVRDGDRIEIYRPLTVDPKAARRQRAALKGR